MFWRRNRQGLSTAFLALALIGGEMMGFALPKMASLWLWMALFAGFAGCIAMGWRLSFARYPIVALAGVALAWRSECGLIGLERLAERQEADGMPPTFDLKVEGDVLCRYRSMRGGSIVRFNSQVDGVAVKVVASIPFGELMPSSDEVWRCSGWLSFKRSAYGLYVRPTLWVQDASRIKRLLPPRGWSATTVYRRMSDVLARRARLGLGWCPELASFNCAMLLGRRTGLTAARRKVFSAAGTMHVFAISGLHVMLVAGLLKMLLEKTGLPMRPCSVCAIPLLAAYVMLSGARPSAVRAALMTSFWLGAGLVGRRPDALAAWGNSAILVYGLSPTLIFDVGCSLSFAVMLGIVVWLRWSAQFASPLDWMRRIAAREQSLGDDCKARSIMVWHCWGTRLLGAFGISLAAWVVGTPLVARMFGIVTIGGLVANVAIVPLAGMAVMLGAGGVAASLAAPQLGAILNMLAAFCTWLMAGLSECVARCPGIFWETLPWSWRDCLLWYAAWLAFAVMLSRHLPPREWIPVKIWRMEDKHEMGCNAGKIQYTSIP